MRNNSNGVKKNDPTNTSNADPTQGRETDQDDATEKSPSREDATAETGGCAGHTPSTRTDAGDADESPGLIEVCPECEVAQVRSKNPNSTRSTGDDNGYVCNDCGASFDEPKMRERRGEAQRGGLAGKLAAIGEERDNDDGLRADGGVVEADPDPGTAPDGGDLSRFQLEILFVLATKPDESDYGLGIKEALQGFYGEEVNHGRLYPNLDTLVDEGLLKKSELDKRTNSYQLTNEGKTLIRRDAQRRHNAVDAIGRGGDR